MAKTSGAAAYQRLTVPNIDYKSAEFAAISAANRRASQAINEQRAARKAKEKAEKEKAFEEEYKIDDNKFKIEESEFRTPQDVGMEAMELYRDAIYDTKEQLRQDPNNVELKKKMGRLNNGVDVLKSSYESVLKVEDAIEKKIADGTLSKVDENRWSTFLDSYRNGRVKPVMNDEGAIAYVVYDEEGNRAETIPFKKLISDTVLYDKVDINKNLSEMATHLGKEVYDKASGGFVNTFDEWGVKQETQASSLVDTFLNNDAVTADLYQQLIDKDSDQRDNFSQEQKDELKEVLMGRLKRAYDTKKEKKPYNRPQPSGGSLTDSLKMQNANNLYDISMRAANGDKQALDQMVGSRIKVQVGDKTVEKVIADYAVTNKGIAFIDNQGNEISVVEKDSNKRRQALKIAMLIQNGQSADDVQTMFEFGEARTGGQFTVGEQASIKTPKEVSALEITNDDVKNIPTNEGEAVDYLRQKFSESGFRFREAIAGFNAVKITAPNGVSKNFYTDETSEIKQFMEDNFGKKTIFEETTSSSNGKKKTPISNN